MKIVEIQEQDPLIIRQLTDVWERSVRATHLFLSDGEIERIKQYVPQALADVPHLLAVMDAENVPLGFMGIDAEKLEMLFIAPEERGKGLGKQLLQYGINQYAVCTLAVNEQNPSAKGFYEHMGFRVYQRAELDEQGNPYPILYMKLDRPLP